MARQKFPLWQSVPLWCVTQGAGLAVSFLPRGLELLAGRAAGRLLFLFARRRRAISEENIRRCMGGMSEAERRDLLRRNFAHFGILSLEILHMFSPLPGHFKRYVQKISIIEGTHNWRKAHDKGKGVLYAGSHLGNWEIVAAQGGLNKMGMTIVTRNLTPQWFHDRMIRTRLSTGVASALRPRILPAVLTALRRGESVVFAMDQYVAPDAGGIKARFFGIPVNTLGAVAVLAQKTGAAIVPGSAYRDDKGLVHVFIEPEIELGDATGDIPQSTQKIVDRIESYVRKHPEQWTWGHRRFKDVDWDDNDGPESAQDPAAYA
jgi:KDO2-lipid IV(A) lauroyltransferase